MLLGLMFAVAHQPHQPAEPITVFLGLLCLGMALGPSGKLLGVPIIMIVKAACDRVENLKPVGELLNI